MKKILIGLLAFLTALSICSCSPDDSNADDNIMEISWIALDAWGLEEGRTFSVVLDDEGIYHIDINGEEMLLEIEKGSYTENEKSNITECDSELTEMITASREMVVNYVNDSRILKDKEGLIEYINGIPVLLADFSEDIDSEYDPELDTLFINRGKPENACEWIIVRELVQALSCKTNSGAENVRYPHSIFNESLTDIITLELQPDIIEDSVTRYFTQYHYVYLYLGCVGMDGIEAYFYGYDKVLEKIPEAELDIFVETLADTTSSEDAIIVACNCINDWGLEFGAK